MTNVLREYSLLAEVDKLYREGVIKPIDFIRSFDISQLEHVIACFSDGTHMGKMVVLFDSPQSQVKVRYRGSIKFRCSPPDGYPGPT